MSYPTNLSRWTDARRGSSAADARGHWRALLPYVLIGLAGCALVLSALAELHEQISDPWLVRLDHTAMAAIHAHASTPLTRLMRALSFIGSVKVYFPLVLLTAAALWSASRRRESTLLLVAVIGSGLLESLLKLHFRRLRPDVPWALAHERSFSFPSGHSVAAMALYGVLAYLLAGSLRTAPPRAAIITAALLLISGIGLSRIYLGVHYPSDVAAGYLVGALWLATLIGADQRARYVARRRNHPPA